MDDKICSFPGCGKKAHSRGLCGGHYRQQREGEQLRPLQQQFHGLSEQERFLVRVRKGEGCWLWTGSLNNGYGQFRDANTNRPVLAHRKSWMLFCGEIPAGLGVLHKCDTPRCVRPDHLFLGDQQANIDDMHAKGRANKRALFGESHGMSRATEELVREIRSASGGASAISRRVGLARSTVEDILSRRTWKHID